MKISQAGLDLLKEFEGLRLNAYLCPANVWTIGYGTTNGVVPGMTITQDEAEGLLREDVEKFEAAVTRLVTVPLEQYQFDSLVSIIYNIGESAFRSSTLLRLLNAGDYAGARGQFGRWVKAGATTLPGLVRRRAAEAEMFGNDKPRLQELREIV